MKNAFRLLLCFLLLGKTGEAQFNWENYSTSFLGRRAGDTRPWLFVARPYNGRYFDNLAIDYSAIRQYNYPVKRTGGILELDSYDSSQMLIFASGVTRANAAAYEFRVVKNDRDIIIPWQSITQFDSSHAEVNGLEPGSAYLGAYATSWENYLAIDLRKKGDSSMVSSALLHWHSYRPVITSLYRINRKEDLNKFLVQLKRQWDRQFFENDNPDAAGLSDAAGPAELKPGDNNLVISLFGEIFKKEALEYQLSRDGKIIIPWKANDFDNNFIWLNQLLPGNHLLQIRYAAQRHQVTTFSFTLLPAWYQALWFRIIMGALMLGFVTLLIALFILQRQRKKAQAARTTREKMQLEMQALRAQLNPHFIFNALSSIQGLVNKNDTVQADAYLGSFAGLLRSTLNFSTRELISLEEELAWINSYLMVEKLRFGFCYQVQTDPGLAAAAIEIPALLLQPLVENAVKHGAGPLGEQGLIEIQVSRSANHMVVIINDNGKGWKRDNTTAGHGLKLTEQRIALFNQLHPSSPVQLEQQTLSTSGSSLILQFNNWF